MSLRYVTNCGERKTQRKGKRWYIYSRIGSSSITILLNFSPSLIRWQFARTHTKYAAPTGPTESSWVIIYVSKLFIGCLTKNGSSGRTHRIVLHHSLYILIIFVPLYFQVAPQPESYLFDLSSLTFKLPYFKLQPRPSEFQKFQFSDSSFQKQEKNAESLCSGRYCYPSLPHFWPSPTGLGSLESERRQQRDLLLYRTS